METVQDGMQKYFNYREQMGRLTRAMRAEFYLEAISIEYAIIEDRVGSVLRHSGKWNPEKQNMLNKKLNKLSELQRAKKGFPVLVRKYISEDLVISIRTWKDQRNILIHALLNQSLSTEELRNLAIEGHQIVRMLNSKVSSYNRAIDKLNTTQNLTAGGKAT